MTKTTQTPPNPFLQAISKFDHNWMVQRYGLNYTIVWFQRLARHHFDFAIKHRNKKGKYSLHMRQSTLYYRNARILMGIEND